MKSYLKVLALICVTAVSAVMLTGCADDQQPQPSSAPGPVQPNS